MKYFEIPSLFESCDNNKTKQKRGKIRRDSSGAQLSNPILSKNEIIGVFVSLTEFYLNTQKFPRIDFVS